LNLMNGAPKVVINKGITDDATNKGNKKITVHVSNAAILTL
jgi:hypothetical protein